MITRPLRLAIDIGPLYGHRTGVGVAVDGMVTALRARDDIELEPYLVSYRSSPHAGHRKLPLPGIAASHLWSRSNRPAADRWIGPADVVHGTNYVAPPTRRPVVVSVYDCWFLANPGSAGKLVQRAGNTLRRRVADGAWVHASSDATADQVRELLGTDRVRTVYLGAPQAVAPSPGDAPATVASLAGRRFVLCVATEERRKGLPLLVHAFEHLVGDHHDLVLVLAGANGDDSDAVTAAIDACGSFARDRIRRLGVVDEPTKGWLFHHATALAYPSIDEGFGFPLLEANISGTPVIATSVGAVREIAGDAAVLVDDRQPMTFAEAIDDVLTDDAVRQRLVEAGHRNVERFRWPTTAERLVELYRDAMEHA